MLRWFKRIFQRDRGVVDFTKIEDHIELGPPDSTPTVRKHKPPPPDVFDYTRMMHRMNTSMYTTITPTDMAQMRAVLKDKIRRLR